MRKQFGGNLSPWLNVTARDATDMRDYGSHATRALQVQVAIVATLEGMYITVEYPFEHGGAFVPQKAFFSLLVVGVLALLYPKNFGVQRAR